MPEETTLPERLVGFAAEPSDRDGFVQLINREIVGPRQAELLQHRLERLQRAIFQHFDCLSDPTQLAALVVRINKDLTATAWRNDEIRARAVVQTTGAVEPGQPAYTTDIAGFQSVDFEIEIPASSAIVVVLSQGWKRSLYYDLSPLGPEEPDRSVSLEQALAQQYMSLLGLDLDASGRQRLETTVDFVARGIRELEALIASKCSIESEYQELFESHPWMLGRDYHRVRRHSRLDDQWTPDFVALRLIDSCEDIIEIKQPFLQLFRQDGKFSANFNDAWNQIEEYRSFVMRQWSYLQDSKQMTFMNPRCVLVAGYDFDEHQQRLVDRKIGHNGWIQLISYDQLLTRCGHYLRELSGLWPPIETQFQD